MSMYGNEAHTDDESKATGSFRVKGAPVEKSYTSSIHMDTEGTSPEVAAEQMMACLVEMLEYPGQVVRIELKDEQGIATLCDVDLTSMTATVVQ